MSGMILRVSLLGRGGQGIKSAAHIAGTAAFLAGYNVQDQPLYGAERRGAPITAFIRISDQPAILERGHAADPSLMIIADESLFDDRDGSAPHVALSQDAILFVNTAKEITEIREKFGLAPTAAISAFDLSHLAYEILGERALIGTAVAGAIAKLLGIEYRFLEQATRMELNRIGIIGNKVEGNVTLAEKAYESVESPAKQAVDVVNPSTDAGIRPSVISPAYQGPSVSACTIVAPGNTESRSVGSWSEYQPLINYDKCTKCMICFVYCPDSAITIDQAIEGFPRINYAACKGCDICYKECPVKAISIVRRHVE